MALRTNDEPVTIPRWMVSYVFPAIISAAMTFGVFTAKQATLDEKIAQIEKVQALTVSKAENVLMMQNLQIQLDNIRTTVEKIDKKIEVHMNKDND